MVKLLIFISLSTLVWPCWAQQWLFVQSTKAKLYSKPTYTSKVIETVKKGTRLETLKSNGRWMQVKFNNNTAWISTLLVAKQPPLYQKSVLDGQQENLQESSRRRASSRSSAAATRGLREEDQSRHNKQQQADYSALEKVEANSVTQQEALDFNKAGTQN